MANSKGRRFTITATKLLKAKIVEKGLTYAKVAELLNISYQSLCYKINNKVEFKASEIEKLCEILDIDDKDAYFFVSK